MIALWLKEQILCLVNFIQYEGEDDVSEEQCAGGSRMQWAYVCMDQPSGCTWWEEQVAIDVMYTLEMFVQPLSNKQSREGRGDLLQFESC